MLVLNLPFKALMFLTLMRPSLVLFLVLWLKLVKDFLKVRCRLALLPRSEERFSRNAETDLVCRLPLEKKNLFARPRRIHRRRQLGGRLPLQSPLGDGGARRPAPRARPAGAAFCPRVKCYDAQCANRFP